MQGRQGSPQPLGDLLNRPFRFMTYSQGMMTGRIGMSTSGMAMRLLYPAFCCWYRAHLSCDELFYRNLQHFQEVTPGRLAG